MISPEQLKQQYPQAIWYQDGFSAESAKNDPAAGAAKISIVEKPWGFEIWLAYTDHYAMKFLIVNQGKRFSLQKHQQKEESWLIQAGHPEIFLNNQTIQASPGDAFHTPAGTVHRVTAAKDDVVILEVSTAELNDVVRLEDDFGRN